MFHFLPGVGVHAQYHLKVTNALTPDFVLTNFPEPGDVSHCEYSVISHLQTRFLSASNAGAAGQQRDLEKTRKYREHTRAAHCKFLPASQEASGRPSAGMYSVLSYVTRLHDKEHFALTASSRTWACPRFKQYLYQRVAIGFWSGSAAMAQTRNRINTTAANTLRV